MTTVLNPKDEIAKKNSLTDLLNEDLINLGFHVKDVLSATSEIDACRSVLELGQSNPKWENAIERIKGSALLSIYKEAVKLVAQNNKNYITGLKIIFGSDGKKISLLYRPVVLIEDEDLGNKVKSYKLEEKSGHYDYYNDSIGKFVPISGSVKPDDLIANYKISIKLSHYKDGKVQGPKTVFQEGIDVESMVFSFQEIFALLYYNPRVGIPNVTPSIFNDEKNVPIKLFHCIREDSLNPFFLNKHSLLLSPNIDPELKEQKFIFQGQYANLAHLCPPNCIGGNKAKKFIFKLD